MQEKHRVFSTHPDGSRTEQIEYHPVPVETARRSERDARLRAYASRPLTPEELAAAVQDLIARLELGDA